MNNKELISFDMGPANAIIDDLSSYFYKKKFDKNGSFAKKGKIINEIFNNFKKELYFKKKFPKSLDRDHFNYFFKILKKYKPNDAIYTASIMTIYSIMIGLKLLRKKISLLVLTGGGRKNLFLIKKLKKETLLKKIEILNIDELGFNGDLVEAQMFGYLAVRSVKKLTISLPSTTGVNKAISGGKIYGKLTKN